MCVQIIVTQVRKWCVIRHVQSNFSGNAEEEELLSNEKEKIPSGCRD